MRAENPDIQQFECSVFNGVYVTRDVDQQYLDYLDSLRNDDAKAVQLQNEVENLEMHNEGKPFTRRGPAVPDGRRAFFARQRCVNGCANGYNPAKSAARRARGNRT